MYATEKKRIWTKVFWSYIFIAITKIMEKFRSDKFHSGGSKTIKCTWMQMPLFHLAFPSSDPFPPLIQTVGHWQIRIVFWPNVLGCMSVPITRWTLFWDFSVRPPWRRCKFFWDYSRLFLLLSSISYVAATFFFEFGKRDRRDCLSATWLLLRYGRF